MEMAFRFVLSAGGLVALKDGGGDIYVADGGGVDITRILTH